MTRRVGVVGPGIGRGGLKRHSRRVLKDSIQTALTKPAVKRLARRAGVKRISGEAASQPASSYTTKRLTPLLDFSKYYSSTAC